MITLNRLRHRLVHAKAMRDSRCAVAHANRIKARTLRSPNPGYDELRHPLFIGVMALAALVLLVDVSDGWHHLDSVVAMLASVVSTIKAGA